MRAWVIAALVIGAAGVTAFADETEIALVTGEKWIGTYACGGRVIEASLEVQAVERAADATGPWRVRARLTLGGGRSGGSVGLEGSVTPGNASLELVPKGFFSLPPGYSVAPLRGTIAADQTTYAGRIAHPACQNFAFVRAAAAAVAVAPPAPRVADGATPASGLPPSDLVVQERFVYRDPAVLGALRMRCPDKALTLRQLGSGYRDTVRQGEALLALAAMESKGECGQRAGAASEILRARRSDAAAAWARADASGDAWRAALAALAPFDDALATLPPVAPAAVARAVAGRPAACAEDSGLYADAAARDAFAQRQHGVTLERLLWYWGHQRFAGGLVCTRAGADGYTEATQPDLRAIAREWRSANGAPAGGLLSADESRALARPLLAFEAQKAEAERQAALAQARERERAQAAERAADADVRTYSSKAKPPQEIYVRAGKFDLADDRPRARALYEFLTTAFPASPWAAKANDRLLALRDEERAKSNGVGAARPATRPRGETTWVPPPNPGDDPVARQDALNQQWARDEEARRLAEDEFVQRQNEQIRRQNEQFQEEERQRRMQQPQ